MAAEIQLARAYLFAQGEIETYVTDPPATAHINAMELMRAWKGHPAIWRAHNKLIKRGKARTLDHFITLVTHGGDRPLQAFGPLFAEPKWAAFATAVGAAEHRVPPALFARLRPMTAASAAAEPRKDVVITVVPPCPMHKWAMCGCFPSWYKPAFRKCTCRNGEAGCPRCHRGHGRAVTPPPSCKIALNTLMRDAGRDKNHELYENAVGHANAVAHDQKKQIALRDKLQENRRRVRHESLRKSRFTSVTCDRDHEGRGRALSFIESCRTPSAPLHDELPFIKGNVIDQIEQVKRGDYCLGTNRETKVRGAVSVSLCRELFWYLGRDVTHSDLCRGTHNLKYVDSCGMWLAPHERLDDHRPPYRPTPAMAAMIDAADAKACRQHPMPASTTSGTGRIVDLRAGTVDSNLLTVLRSCSKHGLEAGLLDILEGGDWTDDDVHAWRRYLKLRRNGWSTIAPKRQLYTLFKRYRTLSSSPDDTVPNQETKKPRSK